MGLILCKMLAKTEDFLKILFWDKERLQLITAVKQNQLEALRQLLDLTKNYKVVDEVGNGLLHIAIMCDNVEVFDHLMSIPDFPLELANELNQTALALAFRGFGKEHLQIREHFAYELIKKGANINEHYNILDTPLHCAIELSYFKVVTLLIQKGVDVNTPSTSGYTPLTRTIRKHPDNLEMFMTLLMSGAQFSVCIFEHCVLLNLHEDVLETMFLLLLDEYAQIQIGFRTVVRLLTRNSPLIDDILLCKYPIEIVYEESAAGRFIQMCITLKKETLRLILARLGPNFKKTPLLIDMLGTDTGISPNSLENLEMMLQSNLRPIVLHFMRELGTYSYRTYHKMDVESEVIKTYCYLLSYGVPLHADDLYIVYRLFGYGPCFKILLHMDLRLEVNIQHYGSLPLFIHNVGTDLEKVLIQKKLTPRYLLDFLQYFRDPRLTKLFFPQISHLLSVEPKAPPPVPRLVELARNAFRKFFVNKFNITTSRRFHTLVNSLDISITYKKIITLETKLYRYRIKYRSVRGN